MLTGTAGRDIFRVADTDADQAIRGYDRDVDQLDLSQMGAFYEISDLDISHTSTGAVFRLGEAQVTVFTANGRTLRERDLTTEDLRDLWHVDTTPLAPSVEIPKAALAVVGEVDPDLLDGRNGADVLLGQQRDAEFDDYSA